MSDRLFAGCCVGSDRQHALWERCPQEPTRFYIDCEFDGHGGPLLSIAMVREDGRSIHIRTTETARDPWVAENVVPLMNSHRAPDSRICPLNLVGEFLRECIGNCEQPIIIADSPVDIGRFCAALSTCPEGGWASTDYPRLTFEVYNVDCYPTSLPGAVQHNAWWDAMALRHVLASGIEAAEGRRDSVAGSTEGESPVGAEGDETPIPFQHSQPE